MDEMKLTDEMKEARELIESLNVVLGHMYNDKHFLKKIASDGYIKIDIKLEDQPWSAKYKNKKGD